MDGLRVPVPMAPAPGVVAMIVSMLMFRAA